MVGEEETPSIARRYESPADMLQGRTLRPANIALPLLLAKRPAAWYDTGKHINEVKPMKKLMRVFLPLLILAVLVLLRLPAQMENLPTQPQNQNTEVLTLAPDTEPEAPAPAIQEASAEEAPAAIDEDGEYTSRDEVALYIHTYGHLPSNFITKKEAEALGWTGGSLEPYAPGKSIGGGYFGNYEGMLPDAKGRKWTECDINTRGKKSRGAERIVFSNDGLIYYTGDHYESFTLLYGEE